LKKQGDAVWKTPTQPTIAVSKEPSSNRSALNKWSLSLAPSKALKCFVFSGLAETNQKKIKQTKEMSRLSSLLQIYRKKEKKFHYKKTLATTISENDQHNGSYLI
jgi:hypothetical protein